MGRACGGRSAAQEEVTTGLLDRLDRGGPLTDLLADAGVPASDLSDALAGGPLVDATA